MDDNDRLKLGTLPHDPEADAVPMRIDRPHAKGPNTAADCLSRGHAWPAPPAVAAFHGLAGDFVRMVDPHTEADPAAVLVQFLVAFGNVVGRGPHVRVEGDRHTMNLFCALVGTTAKGRKGTSWGRVRSVFEQVEPVWASERVRDGLVSGEGIIYHVRDAGGTSPAGGRRAARSVQPDPGVADKRLCALAPELASALRAMNRKGSTLSATLRNAWDKGDLGTLARNEPLTATGAHVSVIAHVTGQELRRELSEVETANGFGNRFLWVCARRSKCLPDGGCLSDNDIASFAARLKGTIAAARQVSALRRDPAATALWHSVYRDLSAERPGLLGAVTGRAEAQVVRLSALYALLDGASVIAEPHLRAALAVWDYCYRSAAYVFGVALGDGTADTILSALLRAGDRGLTRTDVSALFQRKIDSAELTRALAWLAELGLARSEKEPGPRKPERWVALPPTNSAKSAKSCDAAGGAPVSVAKSTELVARLVESNSPVPEVAETRSVPNSPTSPISHHNCRSGSAG